jgi:predicted DNA-binding WGR domain protein
MASGKATRPGRDRVRSALIGIAKILAGNSKRFERIVTATFANPQRTADDLGMEPEDEMLAWIALVQSLVDAEQIASVDWKEDADEIIASIDAQGARRVKRDRQRWAWTTGLELDEIPTADFIARAGSELARSGIRLVSLDIDDDAYQLVLLEAAAAARLVTLAREAGLAKHVTIAAQKPARKPKTKTKTKTAEPKKTKAKPTPKAKRRSPRTRDEIYPWTNLEYVAGSSKKFWGARIYPRALHTTWGRIGTDGQSKWQSFPSKREVTAAAEKAIAAKLRSGYVRTTRRPPDFED